MTFSEYCAIPAENWSRLKHILTSPAHYKAEADAEREETIDMRLGTSVHEYILEGRVSPYVVRPECNGADSLDGWHGNKKWCQAWISAQTLPWYSPKDAERMFRMQRALEQSEMFQKILAMCPEREVTVQAEYMGLPMKARLDMLGYCDGRRLIVDLKKTPEASPRAWGKKAHSMHYDGQLCLYSNLLAMQEKLDEPPMVLNAVVEDSLTAPVSIFSVPQEMWSSGMAKLERAITLLRQCREKDEWPAYGEGILTPEWPRWALSETDAA